MTAFRTKHLAIACGAALSALLYGCAPMTPATSNQAIGNYQFGYQVQSPSDIAAQVFSGQERTYVSLPHGVVMQAATGNGQLYTPKRHGPYWEVKGLATQWTFATTQGIVVAHATGAALQMAKVHRAMAEVQTTTGAIPGSNKAPVVANTDVTKASGEKAPAKAITAVNHGKLAPESMDGVPAAWVNKNAPARNSATGNAAHHATEIPGSDGRSLPLNLALQRIMPAGWTSDIQPPVSPSMPVLWHRGPWTQSLQRMARDNILVTHVAWGRNLVSVSASPAMMAGIPGVSGNAEPLSTKQLLAASPTKEHTANTLPGLHGEKAQETFPFSHATIMSTTGEGAAPTVIPPIAPISTSVTGASISPAVITAPEEIDFVAEKRQMLSHDMRIYLKKKGWDLAWNLTKDYPISVGFTLQGTIKQVLQKLMYLYPITITGDVINHTVVVTSNTRF